MGSREMAALLALVGDGIKVLRQRGVEVTDEQVEERANNIVAAIVGNYLVVPLPPEPVETEAPEWWTPLIDGGGGKPPWHYDNCRCDRCDTFDRSVKQKEGAQ